MTRTLGRLVVASLAVLLIVACGSPNLRDSTQEMTTYLLALTPIGTSKPEVKQSLERLEPKTILEGEGPPSVPVIKLPFRSEEWASYLHVELGGYRKPARTDVIAYYVFDHDDRLIEVTVEKYVDSL